MSANLTTEIREVENSPLNKNISKIINVINKGGLSLWWEKLNADKWKQVINLIYENVNYYMGQELTNIAIYQKILVGNGSYDLDQK